ncbi:wax ester/triacylglycerol synthase domain-containing protein [Nocardia sp. CA-128927]|uniref:wax ester/triacylglycerol synthase domain-containing protein n=1 Tax=Nocardia sp. CA-128927 TaxID=3239975 RepID=UPI003D98C68B
MAPQDATMYWLSGRTRNDLFLLYCFTDSGCPSADLRAFVGERSARIADLRVRARSVPRDLDYPSWVPCEFTPDQFVEHVLPKPDWAHLQAALGEVVDTGVDAAVRPWRLHVFRGITDAPAQEHTSPALVAVLQMSHALADGRRAAEIARALFAEADMEVGATPEPMVGVPLTDRLPGARALAALVARARSFGSRAVDAKSAGAEVAEFGPSATLGDSAADLLRVPIGLATSAPVDAVLAVPRMPIRLARTAFRGYQAFRAQQELAGLTTAGRLPPPGPDFPPSLVNQAAVDADSAHQVRMIVCEAASLRVPERTVTVVVLTAVSLALARYLEERGGPVERLGAQVPMALSDTAMPNARNNYRSLSVDLCIDEPDLRLRADKIAAAMADRRLRAQHPLLMAQDRVTAVVPAPMLRRDIARYPLDAVPDSIAGHTVVSSVHRGPANLTFGGRVCFTGGFPAIGSVMRLTHGVHGLGETVTISLHADTATLPDLDVYAELLGAALDEAAQSLK